MNVRESVLHVLDRAYAPVSDELAWLDGLRSAASDAFEGTLAIQALTVTVDGAGRAQFGSVSGDEFTNRLMMRLHEITTPDDVRAMYFSGPVVSASNALTASKSEEVRALWNDNMRLAGAVDVLGAMGTDASGRICALTFVRQRGTLTRPVRTALGRIAGHLAAALRLCGTPSPDAAFLTPDGRLLDAVDAAAPDSASSLRSAALGIDRARRSAAKSTGVGLQHWKALVEGRWSLIERTEADGRRILVARRNAPETADLQALTERERQVVALVALNHPSKLVAYELGLTESAVSLQLASALRKLGLKGRAALVELHHALRLG